MNARSEYAANRALVTPFSLAQGYANVDTLPQPKPRKAARKARRALRVPAWAIVGALALLAALPVLARAVS